jgi:hypothetical protein
LEKVFRLPLREVPTIADQPPAFLHGHLHLLRHALPVESCRMNIDVCMLGDASAGIP